MQRNVGKERRGDVQGAVKFKFRFTRKERLVRVGKEPREKCLNNDVDLRYLSHKKYKGRLEQLRAKKVDSEPHLVKNYPISILIGNSKRQLKKNTESTMQGKTDVAGSSKQKNGRDRSVVRFTFMSKLLLSPSEQDNSNKTFVGDLKLLVKNRKQVKPKDRLLAKNYPKKTLHIRKQHTEDVTRKFQTKQQRPSSRQLQKENYNKATQEESKDVKAKNTDTIKCLANTSDKPLNEDLLSKEEKDSEEEEDCNTVIEHSCDNDYSMIFNSLNENIHDY
eukprot:TRINITY_DN8401_c0_g1_i5.p1 TRINITY_DN8401_c0_g1~~TRINITY_DN8401_c0_g1_i5.p1  ORF type:complete len:277 (+),score=70.57 TRINITY_DN8401_c0_g1_i5:323-1153(+)